MCKFFSAIVNDEGKVFWKNGVTSHSELEGHFGIRDDGHHAKVELVPVSGVWNDVESWEFTIDEARKPDWWDGAYESNVRQVVKDWMASGDRYVWDGYLDLSGLTSLPAGTVFPKECRYLYLSGLTSLPAGTVFPKECGYLYLSGLTSLPAGTVLPKSAYVPNLR